MNGIEIILTISIFAIVGVIILVCRKWNCPASEPGQCCNNKPLVIVLRKIRTEPAKESKKP